MTMADTDTQDPDALVAVFENNDPTLVSIARDALESVRIQSFIFDENSSRLVYGGGCVPTRLMVYADKLDEARECLNELGFIEK